MVTVLKRLRPFDIKNCTEPGKTYQDGGGLMIRVSRDGKNRSWTFRYQLHGKRRELGIGSLRALTLAQAREIAAELRVQVAKRIDPYESRKATATAAQSSQKKFRDVVSEYLERHTQSYSNDKHRAQWKNTLSTYASAHFGDKAVSEIVPADIVSALEDIWSSKNVTARRVRGRVERVLDYAKVQGYRTGDNPAAWDGNLEFSLPAVTRKPKHHLAMPYADLPKFFNALTATSGYASWALQLLIMTAARSGEVRFSTWDEFDLDAGLWTIPEHRMKAKVQHVVPLSTQAIELLRKVPSEGSAYVFSGTNPKRPISDMTLTEFMRRRKLACTAHGFRSSFRDWSAEQTNFPRAVCEHALAHRLPDQVEAAYLRTSFLDQRRALMQQWSDFIHGVKND